MIVAGYGYSSMSDPPRRARRRGSAGGDDRGQALLAGFATAAQRQSMLAELGHIRGCDAEVEFDLLDGAAIQRLEPALSGSVRPAIRLRGQRYIDPGAFTAALADSVRRRGGIVWEGTGVTGLHADPAGLVLRHGQSRPGPRTDRAGEVPGHRDTEPSLQAGQAGARPSPAAGESHHDAVVLATGAWQYAELYTLQASQYDTVQ